MASRKLSSVVALEFGPSTLRFVEMLPSTSGSPQVLTAGIMALEAGADAETHAAIIRAILSQTSSFNGGTIAASVPLRHGFLRIVTIPRDIEPYEASELLRWDMSHYLARPLDWYALDFQPQEDDGNTESAEPPESRRYLAAAYRLSEVETLCKAITIAGKGEFSALEIDALSIVRVFATNYPECLPERTLVIKADTQSTSFFRTLQGEYRGGTVQHESHDAPDVHALDPQDRAENLRHRTHMISRGLGEALGDWGEPERIFICGDLAGDADFRELLKGAIPAPLALLNPFRKISGPNPDTYPGAYPGAPFAATVGVGLRAIAVGQSDAREVSLNLLRHLSANESEPSGKKSSRTKPARPRGEKLPRDPRTAKRLRIALGLLAILIAGGFVLKNFEWIRTIVDSGKTSEYSAPSASFLDDSTKRALDQKASTLIADQQAATLAWLRELESPLFMDAQKTGVTLLRTVFTTPDAFLIKGVAKSMEALSRFQETLVLVPGLELHRSNSKSVRRGSVESLEFLFSGILNHSSTESAEPIALVEPAKETLPATRVLPKMESERELGRFVDTASRAGIDFINLEMPPPTVSGALAAHPYRLTVLCDKGPGCDLTLLRTFLENESRRDSPIGIQRITVDHTVGSQMIFLDIMAFSR